MTLVDPRARTIRSLGPVGPIAFGLWRYTDPDRDRAQRVIEVALDHGMNLIDGADVYGLQADGSGFGRAEEILGEVLRSTPRLRERMVLATKGGITPPVPYDSSPAYLRSACEASLRRLGVDVIDLYQIHRPDLLTHPTEVAATLTALRSEGKIREVGVSNHTPAQVAALAAHLPFPIATNQPEYSAVHLDPLRDGTFDACMRDGTVPLVWSPLGGGVLATGEGVDATLLGVIDDLAARERVDRPTIALAFALAHPAAPVAIIGSQTPDRVAGSVAALGVELSRTDVYAIVQASEGVALP